MDNCINSLDNSMKIRALGIYFQHWGKDEITQRIQQQGQKTTNKVIHKEYLYCVSPHRMSQYVDEISKKDFFQGLMFEGDTPESIFLKMKELAEALLNSTPHVPSGCKEGFEYHNPRFVRKVKRVVGDLPFFCYYSEKQKASLRRVDALLSLPVLKFQNFERLNS